MQEENLNSISSREKTAFAVHGRGLYEFVVIPFDLVFRKSNHVSSHGSCYWTCSRTILFYYLDDIIIVTPDFDTEKGTSQA
ncbi:hypothetical protein JTB14_020740 [Gonioctena quinquepunctata]|nr:hypothetical protein JTB14_020740 [Gonioctena quinquepunctata]